MAVAPVQDNERVVAEIPRNSHQSYRVVVRGEGEARRVILEWRRASDERGGRRDIGISITPPQLTDIIRALIEAHTILKEKTP